MSGKETRKIIAPRYIKPEKYVPCPSECVCGCGAEPNYWAYGLWIASEECSNLIDSTDRDKDIKAAAATAGYGALNLRGSRFYDGTRWRQGPRAGKTHEEE